MIQINSIDTYNKIKAEVNDIVFFDDSKKAFKVYKQISGLMKEEKLGTTNAELSKKYNKLLNRLQWIAVHYFNINKVLGLFDSHLQIAFELEDYDLPQKMKSVFLSVIDFDERDRYKKKLLHILNKNEAVLTNKRFIDNSIPTVENWVKKYTSKTSVGQVEAVKFEEFFIKDADVLKLDNLERQKLKDFFKFYERLKASSLTVAGFDGSLPVNTRDFKGYIQNGAMEGEARLDRSSRELLDSIMGINQKKYDVDSEINKLESKESNYAEGSLEKKMIDEELKKERKIKELQMVADGYKEGSFERKAVLEEIEKMKKL